MKQYKIKIPKDTWAIPGVLFSHAFYLGYWRKDEPDFSKEYMYLWNDGEITFDNDKNMLEAFPEIKWCDIPWYKFLLLKFEN